MTIPAGLGRTTPPRDSWLWWFYSAPVTLQELQDLYIQRILALCKDDRKQTARVLGIGRTTLYRYLKRANDTRGVRLRS
jgi:DNA-binding NtrC family response regulator